MRLIAAPFAERLSGPDMVHGFKADMLIETWRYAWSPAVEAALIERAADGDDVAEVAAVALLRALDALEKDGCRNDAQAVMNLLVVAFDAGLGVAATRLIAAAVEAASADSDLARITGGLIVAHALESRAARLVAEGVEEPLAGLLPPLVNELVRRLAALLPDLAVVGKNNAAPAIAALASLAEFLTTSSPGIDATPLRNAAERLLSVRLDPAIHGAMIALAALAGLIDEIDAGRRLSAALAGISLVPGDAMRTVSGVMAVAPHLVVRNGEVIGAIDRLFGAVDDEGFLALLPELRLGFAELSPSETDQIAAAVAALHGVGEDVLVQLEGAPDARVLSEHLALSEGLRRRWSADGIGDWLEEEAAAG
jgi:hypothetical protein